MKKNKIEIVNCKLTMADKKFLKKILENLISLAKIKDKIAISLVLMEDYDIKKINKLFRNKDKITTVLYFPLLTKKPKFILPRNILYLGDIILNIERIRKNSKDRKEFRLFIKENLVHAFLHLLLYSHNKIADQRKMGKKEKELLKELDAI